MEESASRQKKRSDRKGNKTRQKNKRGDSKVESNDSPEIPDKGETSDIVERTNKAEIRPEEQSEKTESCLENLWNEIQLKGP